MRKLRWIPINVYNANNISPTLAYSELLEDGSILYWGAISYGGALDDKYYGVVFDKNRELKTTQPPFESFEDAIREIELKLFEDGVRDEA